MICDSGNGWHIWFRVELDNARENYELLENCLLSIAAKFNNKDAEIDTSLADPAQVIKIYGSWVRKGEENTAERPWRVAAVVQKPDKIDMVTLEQLQALAAEAPPQEKSSRGTGKNPPALVDDFDIYDFAEHYGLEIREEERKAGATYYYLAKCPFKGDAHSGSENKTALVIGETLGFRCFSDECDRYRISDLIRHLTPEYGPYQKQIWLAGGPPEWWRESGLAATNRLKPNCRPQTTRSLRTARVNRSCAES